MKPKYIFSAVLAVCLLMFTILPRLATSSRASASSGSAVSAAALSSAPAVSAVNAVAAPLNAGLQPAPTQAPAVLASPTAPAAQPPAQNPPDQKDSAPVDSQDAAIPVPATLAPDAASTALAAANGPVPQTSSLPDLASFTDSVTNGQANTVTGVYVDGVLALPVIQQPVGQDEYVSDADGSITQYSRAAAFGTIGLLAHNTLSGREFFNLKASQQVVLIYGSGRQARYKVTGIEYYQALSSHDPYSDFVDLNNSGGRVLNHEELFRHLYTVDNQLVFQTCFAANGDLSWGRMFVIAEPM